MVNAQEWFDENCPKEKRKEITELSIRRQNLRGSLNLEGFVNLEILICYENQLTNLNLSDCGNLQVLWCSSNQFTNLSFLQTLKNPEKLIFLNSRLNNINS